MFPTLFLQSLRSINPFKFIFYDQYRFLKILDFQIVFNIFIHFFDINRSEYIAIRKMLTFFFYNFILRKINALFNQLITFKTKINKRFFFFDIYIANILLKVEKLFTKRIDRKRNEFQTKTDVFNISFHIIDPINLFTTFLLSNVIQTIYIDLIHFVDFSKKLYYFYN